MLYLLLLQTNKIKKKKKQRKRRETWLVGFFPGQIYPSGSTTLGFLWLLGVIKSCLNGQSLNFMCTQCVGSYEVG
jgi:hypothetical protein